MPQGVSCELPMLYQWISADDHGYLLISTDVWLDLVGCLESGFDLATSRARWYSLVFSIKSWSDFRSHSGSEIWIVNAKHAKHRVDFFQDLAPPNLLSITTNKTTVPSCVGNSPLIAG